MKLERILHTADLHFGEHDPVLVDVLLRAVADVRPQLLVVCGDLTKRARSHEFREARAFLDALPVPHLVVPGNHDIPLLSLRRLLSPYGKYRRHLGEHLEPEVEFDNVLACGLNTTANWRWKEGWLRHAERELRASSGRLAIFASHHPLGRALSRHLGPRPSVLLLHGHHHRAYARIRGTVLEVGATTGTSPRTRDRHNGFNVVELDGGSVTVRHHTANRHGHWPAAAQRFIRTADGWRAAAGQSAAGDA